MVRPCVCVCVRVCVCSAESKPPSLSLSLSLYLSVPWRRLFDVGRQGRTCFVSSCLPSRPPPPREQTEFTILIRPAVLKLNPQRAALQITSHHRQQRRSYSLLKEQFQTRRECLIGCKHRS